jgi:hypothetical protein
MRYLVVLMTLYTYMLFAKKIKNLCQPVCAQIFTDDIGLMYAYPMKKKAEAGLQLEKLVMTLKMIILMGQPRKPAVTGSKLSRSIESRTSTWSCICSGSIMRNPRYRS